TINAIDDAGNTAQQVTSIIVNTAAPVISGLAATRTPISPNGDGVQDSTDIAYNLSEGARVTVVILDGNGNTVRTLLSAASQTAGNQSVQWDGKDHSGNAVADGTYTVLVNANDVAGNTAVQQTTTIAVDTVAPVISSVSASPNAISPNGDGV